jgi:uncharacterized protein YkwD
MFSKKKFIYFLIVAVMAFGSTAISSGLTKAALSATAIPIQNSNIKPSMKNTPAVTPQLLAQSDFQAQLLQLLNAERQKIGAPPLRISSQLAQAAQRHADDMAKNNFLSHEGSDGSTMESRIQETGYAFSAIAENVAGGQPTPESVIQTWLNSSGHRRNMLNPEYTEIGIGYATNSSSQYTHYWTQVFGTPR